MAQSFEEFVNRGRQANTHPAKLLALSALLREVFGVELEDLIPGIETKLGSKILGVRGSADLIFSNIVFELKLDVHREEDDYLRQLPKYFQALSEKYPGDKFVGIATDCTIFKAYTPVFKHGVVEDVREISSIDVTKSSVEESILWIDSFVFSKPKIRPSADDLKWRFGPKSPTYSLAIETLQSLWDSVSGESEVKLKLRLWSRNLEIVYGSSPAAESFIAHTYLVALVKLIVYLRISKDTEAREKRIKDILSGEYFSSHGITNLIEEDYFAWILHPKVSEESARLAHGLVKELLRYDFTEIDEDFFKEIYQEIVERGERHRVGEYYTPEWLSALTLNEALKAWPQDSKKLPRILDPACGSGTFLTNTIHYLRKELQKQKLPAEQSAKTVLSSVLGMDVNPLAVVIARSNYILAMGDLIQYAGRITIPVFVSDSLRIPSAVKTVLGSIDVFEIEAGDRRLQIPMRVASDRAVLSKVLDSFREATSAYRDRSVKKETKAIFGRLVKGILSQEESDILGITLDSILSLIDEQSNAIWIFMLNNAYAPMAMKDGRFDLVIGNPPWIELRFIENEAYQKFVKESILKYDLLDPDQTHLYTHMEIATFFFRRTADLYLRENGIIAFVMPRSVLTGALHHANFKKMNHPSTKLLGIIDTESVSPLFGVPSCVLIGIKGGRTSYPVAATKYSGVLNRKNSKLTDALKDFSIEEYQYKPPSLGVKRSVYYEKLRAGAAIYPRTLVFVDFEAHPILGIDLAKPRVHTSLEVKDSQYAKAPWKDLFLEGNIESDFVFATIVGGEIVPFGFVKLRPVLLPIEATSSGFRLLDIAELRRKGYTNAASWFEKAQQAWIRNSTPKSRKNYPNFLDAIDYQSLLTSQNPRKRYLLLYAGSGTNISAFVFDRKALGRFQVEHVSIKPTNFVVDKTTWFIETDDSSELQYLCAILNSDIVNKAIKPLQTRGEWGERHVHRRPFMFPIPTFEETRLQHKRLAELSSRCHKKVSALDLTGMVPARARATARDAIGKELSEIDEIVTKMLKL
jgi:type I restriction-modification system DNA methylase subunit